MIMSHSHDKPNAELVDDPDDELELGTFVLIVESSNAHQ